MTIKRIDAGKRMSQAVIHNGTVYLAGQVALDAPGKASASRLLQSLPASTVCSQKPAATRRNCFQPISGWSTSRPSTT